MSVKKTNAVLKREQQQLDLAKSFIMLGGNMTMAARTCGVAYATARRWQNAPWWSETIEQLKESETIELSPKLKRIVDKSLELIQDRLDHGDFMYDQKTGKVIRKEVSVRDALAVFKDAVGVKQQMEAGPKQEAGALTIQETLQQLAKNFEELAAKQRAKPVIQVTDVLFVDDSKDS
jgi:hypothetical protein